MDTGIVVAVHVPQLGDERHKNWAKVVTNVDAEKTGGWAFDGDFIATGGIQDVPAPSVLLVYGEKGSRANPQVEARVYLANTDGTLSQRAAASGRAWARTLRDEVAELVAADAPVMPRDWDPSLIAYSTAALEEELARRSNIPRT